MNTDTFKNKNKISINVKLMTLSLLIALIPLIISLFISYYIFKISISNNIENNFKLVSNNLYSEINKFMDYYKSIVNVLVYDPIIKNTVNKGNMVSEQNGYDKKNIKELEEIFNKRGNTLGINDYVVNLFNQYIKEFGSIKEIFITNKYGHNVDVSHKTSDFVQSDEEWWQNAMNEGMYIEDVEYDESSKSMAFTICAVVPHPDNEEKNGVIKVAIDFSDIENAIQESVFGKTGEIYLVNKDKFMITESRFKNDLIKENIIKDTAVLSLKVDTLAVNDVLKGNKGYKIYKNYRGKKVVGYYIPLVINGWGLITEQDISEVNADINKFIASIIILGLLISIIVLFISLFFARSISIPIKIITEGARRFSVGDIRLKGMNWDKINMIEKRKDELGVITNAFFGIIEYLKDKVFLAKEIAKGNLDINVSVLSDTDELGIAMQTTVNSLNDLLGNVNSSINQVNTGAIQVSAASQQLSQGASEQASSLEEITSSITEINSQAKKNADSAREANDLVTTTKEIANEGNNLMMQLVNAMDAINEKSDQIKKIIKIIDDIAFQTNLLALNANVEAARAGKYGKGFAVVAEEVRNLASRSADSVKETTIMVEDTMHSIESSNILLDKTAKQLEEIVKSADAVVKLAEEIAVASNEQAQGLDQITLGLGQIDQVTQQNTASAEESASAAEELASQAELLKGMINKFRLSHLLETEQQRLINH